MPLWLEVLFIVVLAIANGLFAAAEIAVISIRRSRLKELVAEGNEAAARVEGLRHDPERFLATVQIGITVIGATAAAFGGAALSARLGGALRRAGLGDYSENVALTTVILFVSYVSLVLGELVPKSLALRAAEPYAMFVARPLIVLATVARPVVWLLTASSNLILRLFGDRTNFTEARLSPEELQQLVEEAATEGDIAPGAGEIASRALGFGRIRIDAVMLPRTAFQALDASLDGELLRRLADEVTEDRHVVYETSPENLSGYVTLRDMLQASSGGRTLRDVMRPPYFVPKSALAIDVLREMQRRRTHLAMVVDEQGSVIGVVTLEELVEELVGDIFAEHQQPSDDDSIRREADGTALVRGAVSIHEVNRQLRLTLPESESWSTLAGLVVAQLGKIPEVGSSLVVGGVTVEVVEATRRRVKTLRVGPLPAADAGM